MERRVLKANQYKYMKNKDLISIYQALSKMDYQGVKFSYFVVKNLSILGPEIDVIQKTIEPSKEFTEYDTKRVALAEKYAKKDKEGKPITEKNVYIMEDQKAFDKDFEKLKKESKAVLDARTKQIEDYENLLDEESKVEPYKIKQENLPEDIKTFDLRSIFNLIEE